MGDSYPVLSMQNAQGLGLDLTLHYTSHMADGEKASLKTVMGFGWSHSYNLFLFQQGRDIFKVSPAGLVTQYKRSGRTGPLKATRGHQQTIIENPDGSIEIRNKDGLTFRFEKIPDNPLRILGVEPWMLVRITDRNHNVTQLIYQNGLLDRVEDVYGRQIRFGYDTAKRLITITTPMNRVTSLTYDRFDNLATLTDPLTQTIIYAYNMRHQMTEKTDKKGNHWLYEYDAGGHPVGIRDGDGAVVFHLSNSSGWATSLYDLYRDKQRTYTPSVTTRTDGNGNPWQYHYDENGLITRRVAPDGCTTTYTYDPLTLNRATETDANGNTTLYEYDSMGNQTKRTDCQGNETLYTYEPVYHQMKTVTDPRGRVTTYDYDTKGNLIKETDPLGNVLLWTYDTQGNVLSEVDKNGNCTTYTYDAYGNRLTATDCLGFVTTMTYDIFGNMLNRIDANGHVTTHTYDALDRLITETDPLGNVTQYVYDGNNNRVQIIDCNGNVTRQEYDLRDRLIKTIDAMWYENGYTYDGNDNPISVIDAMGNATTSTYDMQNRLVRTTDALGNTSGTAYDCVGNKLTETDANGNITTFVYDCLNRLIQQTDAAGCVTLFAYDTPNGPACPSCSGPTVGSSMITQKTDGNGKVTYYKYDALNRLIREIRKERDAADLIDPSDAVTEYTYDAAGNRLTLTEPNGNITTYAYDCLNRLITETNGAGDIAATTYDPVGNVLTVTAPNGNVTMNTYDANNRLIRVEDSAGLVAEYSYDCAGNRLAEKDGNGNGPSYTYDVAYRLVQMTDPLGKGVLYEYDPVGNLIRTTDRNGNITTQAYDAVNRRITITDALGNITQYEYDNVGNLEKITDAKGNPTQYEYDPLNRLIKEIYADGGIRSFTYDCVGNILTRTDQKGQTTTYGYNDLYFLMYRGYPVSADDFFTYDLSGRMLSAERGGWLVTFTYDGANRVTQSVQNGQTIGYLYDIPGRTRTITYPGGRGITERMDLRARLDRIDDAGAPPPIAEYVYDPGNRVTGRTYRNGTVASYTYNANNWITDLEHSFGITRIAGFGHAYDPEGNKLYEEKRHDPTDSEAYEYDAIYRLIAFKVGELVGSTVPVPVTQSQYNLDALGNWDSKTTDGLTENRTHNTVNEITAIDGVPITHDDNGNLEEDENFTYAYDEENRLIRVTRKSDSRVVGQYQYDALSRRVVKLADPEGVLTETRFFYDNARVIEEQDSVTATKATYVYGNYIDEVLTMDRAADTYYYHQNALWSVAAVTDSAANVVERYTYDAYGYVTVMDGSGTPVPPNVWGTPHSTIDNPYMFTGRRLDEETGLYYYRARYYDCLKGRFLQRDPLGFVDGMNLYEFISSNPANFKDPLGLFKKPSFIKCCPIHIKLIKKALKAAEKMAINAYVHVHNLRFPAHKKSDRYKTWFGKDYSPWFGRDRSQKVRKAFRLIKKAIVDNTISFDCSGKGCQKNYIAYVYPGGELRVWLCEAFFRASVSGRDSQGGAIVHEISHEVAKTDDIVYGESGAKRLTKKNPEEAIRNADNYEYCAEDSYS